MRKDQKGTIVERLAENLGRASIALISEYKGMTAAQSDDMRRRLRAVRGEFRVAKNTLVRRAIKDTRYEALGDKLGGPVGLILSYADPVELAKTVTSMRELGDKFKVRGGVLDGKALSAEEVQAFAALPPREVIFAQLLGLAGAVTGARDAACASAQRAGFGNGAVARRDQQAAGCKRWRAV